MPTIIQDPQKRSPYWIAVVSVGEKRVWKTTKIPIVPRAGIDVDAKGRPLKRADLETKARIVASGIEKALLAEREGSATEANLKRILSDILERTEGKRLTSYTIESWLDEWLAGRQNVAGRTLLKYQQARNDFLDYLGPRRNARLDSLTAGDFIGFRERLLKEGRAPQTVDGTVRKVLGAPIALAWKQGHIPNNPLAALAPLKATRAERGVFSPADIAKLCSVASTDWKGVILMAYSTGARLQDVCNLRWENVDLETGRIEFIARKTGRKTPGVMIPELERHLLSIAGDDPKAPLFPTLAGKRGPGKSGLSMAFRRIMEKAVVPAGVAREKKGKAGRSLALRSFHSLRHSFNSAMANADVSIEIRRKLTGHSSDEMNAHYTHHEIETFKRAVSKLPPIPL